MLCHRTMVAGWNLQAELVLHNVTLMQVRVNGENYGPPLTAKTLAHGRRQYNALLKQLSRPRQMRLPI